MRRARTLAILGILCILGWYFFIKSDDYIVRFKVATAPGTLFKQVEEWSLIREKMDSFSYTINKKMPFEALQESIETKNMNLQLDWNFSSINDSVTQVNVGVSEEGHSFYNRLTAPFLNTNFKKTTIALMQDYTKGMEFRLKNKFKVKCVGIDTIPEIRYAYVKMENVNMLDKAGSMMKSNAEFLKFLNDHGIKSGSFPFLIVDRWNILENTIDFRYCFPIKKEDSLPFNNRIKYDVMPSRKVIKAIYNGNYKTSDRAWFALYEYAKRHNIPIETKPIEVYKDDPHNGLDELSWIAEVYMPLK